MKSEAKRRMSGSEHQSNQSCVKFDRAIMVLVILIGAVVASGLVLWTSMELTKPLVTSMPTIDELDALQEDPYFWEKPNP